jgi:hypothetical protein
VQRERIAFKIAAPDHRAHRRLESLAVNVCANASNALERGVKIVHRKHRSTGLVPVAAREF